MFKGGSLNLEFCLLMVISGVFGFCMTMSRLLSVSFGGAQACGITAVVKDVLLTYVSFIFFDDARCTPMVLIGLAVSFCGVFFQLVVKVCTKQQEKIKEK